MIESLRWPLAVVQETNLKLSMSLRCARRGRSRLQRSRSEAPQLSQERSRLNFVCIKNEIAKRLGRAGPNVILSNFMTTVGFTAHLLAESLELPHIALIAGTDFTRGFRNRIDRQAILEVCRGARMVVGKSMEQIQDIRRHLPDLQYRLVETSVKLPARRWRRATCTPIVIFSDGGFSFKKGTGVLMDAFMALRAKGVPVRLLICGADQVGQEDYWTSRRRRA